jgi:hypothetical protein
VAVYYKYSDYLKAIYGEKVYKIPINLPVTCPNRDGNCGVGGCTFCDEIGAGYEMLNATQSIASQLSNNIAYIKKRYKAYKFIAYLQNYSNTYMSLETFKSTLNSIEGEEIVGISIATRPDCIADSYLEVLKNWQSKNKKDVCIELGLQTPNYHTLAAINRGHGLAEYVDAVLRIKAFEFKICTHLILNLPDETMADAIESAKLMSALKIDYVKLHALYILKDTVMGKAYLEGNIHMITKEAYKERVIMFLRYLSPDIVVQRLIGRAPESFTLFANWQTSWWKIHDEIVETMTNDGYCQGDLCDYLNGKALRKFQTSTKEAQ